MKPSEKLLAIRGDLDVVLTKREEGTIDYPRTVARIDTAYQRALDRAGGGHLPSDGERGGSSNPRDGDERKEAERVKRQAERDARKIDELVIRLSTAAHELREITDRQAEVVHESKLPTEVLPGCRSCARKEDADGKTVGGHWAPVDDKGSADGLCRQCVEFKNATGGLPPVTWCHKRHCEGGKAANRWLAKEFPKLLESVQRKAKGDKLGISVEDLALRPEDLLAS